MRQLKMAVGLGTTACAFALMAMPAMAEPENTNPNRFLASRLPKPISPAEPAKTMGRNEGDQAFKFGVFKIVCKKVDSKGAVAEPVSRELTISLKFSHCFAQAKYGGFTAGTKTTVNSGKPITFIYHFNGFGELGTETEESESEVKISGGNSHFKISGKICNINWPAQTVPAKAVAKPEGEYSSAVYSNDPEAVAVSEKFPEGIRQKLRIANEFKGMQYNYEGGQCLGEGGFEEEASKEEGKTASYQGTLLEEAAAGNLSFGTPPE